MLSVSVPDGSTKGWLETEYAGVVSDAIRELHLPVGQVGYEVRASRGAQSHVVASGDAVWKNQAAFC